MDEQQLFAVKFWMGCIMALVGGVIIGYLIWGMHCG
jgi:uncharacterized membrane-anchored protein YhcB (DUF1043 family)